MQLGSKNNLDLLRDRPIERQDEDLFGYSKISGHVVNIILNLSQVEGFVIAVNGKWGTGKTSFINLITNELKARRNDQEPIILEFNPWWFGGSDKLTLIFFDQLLRKISKYKALKSVAKMVFEFATLIGESEIPYAKTTGKAFSRLQREKDIFAKKEQISNMLRKRGERILVVIDDIDRLYRDEIRQLFCIIKAIADFPQIVYLLAFDRTIVVDALEDVQGIPGDAYLEKIVQLPIELPAPDKIMLRRMIFEKLDILLDNATAESFDVGYWYNVYFDGIDHFMNSPRNVIRLINSLYSTYPIVKGEVNTVDFIAIETLRVFQMHVYEIVKNNEPMFSGHAPSTSISRPSDDELKAFHGDWIKGIGKDDVDAVKRLLMRLFPKLESVWGNSRYGADFEKDWRKQLRICSSDIFPIFFRLALPEGKLSTQDIHRSLSLAEDTTAFSEELLRLASTPGQLGLSQVAEFLELLETYSEDVLSKSIPNIVQSLFDVGDDLIAQEDRRPGVFEYGNDIRVGRAIWRLLKSLDEPMRYEALKNAIEKGRSLYIPARELSTYREEHEKTSESDEISEAEKMLSLMHLEELEHLALEKLRVVAKQGNLMKTPYLLSVLHQWARWSNIDEPRNWVNQEIENDTGLLSLLASAMQTVYSHSAGDMVSKKQHRLDPEWLSPFLDVEAVANRLKAIRSSDALNEVEEIATEQFLKEYELRKQGKNPDRHFISELPS